MTTTTTTHDLDAIRDEVRRETIDAAIDIIRELVREYQDEYTDANESGDVSLAVAHYAQIQALNTTAWHIDRLRYRN